jgi:hypothetical protein
MNWERNEAGEASKTRLLWLRLKQPKLCQRGLQYHRLFVAMDDVVDLIMKSFLEQIITESSYAFMKPSFI